jgi:dTDP-4-amino-4,6-dideoxygalactose transaminase
MYYTVQGYYVCLSFHYAKHLPIGRGGMILLDDKDTADTLRRMRYDGRREGVKPTDDTFDVPGYHCLMHPDDAARGLALMNSMPDHNEDLPNDDYADLSQFPMFTEGL